MSQLDDILAQHGEEGCPDSRAFRRELVIAIKRQQMVYRALGLRLRRARGRSAA